MAKFCAHTGGDEAGHGSRPWVYFMIDSFFLITLFFVVTFQVKQEEAVLPQKLPPGGIRPGPGLPPSNGIAIHVSRQGAAPAYVYLGQPMTLGELNAALERTQGAGRECSVRVSYDAGVPFGDVMAVFNACARMEIRNCGLAPLRGRDGL